MKSLEIICFFLDKAGKDVRIGPVHISLYVSILKCCHEQGKEQAVAINTLELMQAAKIYSSATYHRTIRQLNEFGYIKYNRAMSRWEKSKVSLVN